MENFRSQAETSTSLPSNDPLIDTGARAHAATPLRVLIVVSEAPPIVSGISRCVERLMTGLRARGHTVDVLSAVDVPRLMLGEIRLSSFAFRWPHVAKRFGEYDVINLHGPIPTMSDVFLLLSHTLPPARRPLVIYTHHSAIDIHGLGPACALYNIAHTMLAHGANRVITSSHDYADVMSTRRGAPVDVVAWGTDVPACRGDANRLTPALVLPQGGAEAAPMQVLFVGQMRPYKGVEILLRAVAGQPSLNLTLVGSGVLADQYARLAETVGASNARFTGRLSDEELWEAYESHDVIVLPSTSRAEAFGLVLLEGMSYGCVPVASDLPGVRAVAAPTGRVVPPRDPNALRHVLLALAADRTGLEDLKDRSRAAAAAMTWERVIDGYERAFHATLSDWQAAMGHVALPPAWQPQSAVLDTVRREFGARSATLSLLQCGRGRQPTLCAAWASPSRPQAAGRLIPPLVQSVVRSRLPHLVPAGQGSSRLGWWFGEDAADSLMLIPFQVSRGLVALLAVEAEAGDGAGYDVTTTQQLIQWLGTRRLLPRRYAALLGSTVVLGDSGA